MSIDTKYLSEKSTRYFHFDWSGMHRSLHLLTCGVLTEPNSGMVIMLINYFPTFESFELSSYFLTYL
jgi:hypothetical protein